MEQSNDVIIERIEGLKLWIGEKFDENKKEHKSLQDRVDSTNGRVKKLEIWRAYLIGAWAVVSIVLGISSTILIRYYINNNNVESQIENVMSQYFEK